MDLCGASLLISGCFIGTAAFCFVIFLGRGFPVLAAGKVALVLRECCSVVAPPGLYMFFGSVSGPVERIKSAKSRIELSLCSVGSRGAMCFPPGDLGTEPGTFDDTGLGGGGTNSITLDPPLGVVAGFARKPFKPLELLGEFDTGDICWSLDRVRVAATGSPISAR